MVSEKKNKDGSEMNVVNCGTESKGFLPDDLVIIILLCLDADIIYNVMRYVCKQWYNIIQSPAFISSHFKKSSSASGLLMNIGCGYSLKPTSNHGCSVDVKDLKFKCVDNIQASCNGFVFVLGRDTERPSYIANLVTKQHLPIPLFPDNIIFGRWYFAYAAASKVYKVFYTGYKEKLILTVGVDKAWRKVNISRSSSSGAFHLSPVCVPLRGVLYWVHSEKKVPFIFSFDMETETFREQIPFHPECSFKWDISLCVMGNSLCMFKEVHNHLFEFWVLKDPETGHGKWERIPDINFKRHMRIMRRLLQSRQIEWVSPRGWLRNGELLVLVTSKGVLVYDVNTQEFYKPEELNESPYECYSHVESLIPINSFSLKDNMRHEFEALNL